MLLPFLRTPLLVSILAASCAALPVEGAAQRNFQRAWQRQYDARREKPVTIIEDHAPERDLDAETYIFPDPLRQIIISAFPSTSGLGLEGEEEQLLTFSAYSRGALGLEIGSPAAAVQGFEEALAASPNDPWLKMRLARAAMMVNDLARAQALLEELVAEDADNFRAKLLLGELAMMRQRIPDARRWFEQVLEIRPRNIQALEALCQISYEFFQDLVATKEYSQRILFIDDRNAQAMLYQAEASAFTGDVPRAAELYARLIRTRPSLIERVNEVGRRLTALGRPQDARLLYEAAIKASPMNPDLRRAWENAVRLSDGDAGMRQAWQELAASAPQDLRIADLYADFLKRTNDWDGLATLRSEILEREPEHIPSLMDMAEFFLRRGVFSESEAYLERATRQRSVDPAVYRQAGLAYLLHGDRSMARELLNKALVQNDRDLQTLDALATLEEAEGNRKAAEEHLRAALVVSPANTYVLNRLGNLYLKAGERRQARELFQQVIATKPDDIETWLLLAGMYFEDNDWNNLQILDREVAQRLGNSTRFHAAFGELAMSWGDFDRARISLERTVLLAPGDLRSRNLLARTYVQLDEEDRAIEVLRQAENHLATSAARRERDHRLADLLLMLNRPAEAEKVFDELIRADADDLLAHRGRLQSMVRAGRSDDASREMANLLRVRSGDTSSELVRLQTTVMREQSDYARAQTLLSKAVEQHPNDYDLVLQLALVAADAGDIAEAERRYRSLMELGPGPTNPWFETAANNLGYLFATKGIRLDEAEDLIKDALALNPRAAYILDSLGVVYLKKGDLSKAREYLERAARFAIRDGEIYTNLGQLYEKLGERDMARRMYDKAVLIDPKSQIARDRLDAMADTPSTPTLRQ